MRQLTNQQARRFLLTKHGLLGAHTFKGKQGVLDYIRQTGCVQFDPVDVCGKNAELVCQSRVKDFSKDMLDALLYRDRLLVDFPDKNLSIFPVEDWPYFARYRQAGVDNVRRFPEIGALTEQVREQIAARGPVCSDDIQIGEGGTFWHSAIHWSAGSNMSRSVLEQMYSTGELVIHHKKGSRKYYDLSEKYIPAGLLSAPDPLPDEHDHRKWRVLRRIGAVGLLWNKPSDAWLNIWGLDAAARNAAFQALLNEGHITEISVEGIKDKLYVKIEDTTLIDSIIQPSNPKPRCELIAALDCMMWDRKLIRALFGFEYSWEIYTPAVKRKYGHYTLPLLYGDQFIGRAETAADRKTKTLVVKHIWYEDEKTAQVKKVQKAVNDCFERFAVFNGCEQVDYLFT